jgi:eukaryotic-like serine/threonine-protein kinase
VRASQPIKIVPKGLRCFDAQAADFFLELLPGPRDRQGLPDGIRFWTLTAE